MNAMFGGYVLKNTKAMPSEGSPFVKNDVTVISLNDGTGNAIFGTENTVSRSEDGCCVLLFLGCIWNIPEIRQSLKCDGLAGSDIADSLSVLRDSLTQHGISAVKNWNGQFSFAFWNKHTQTLILGRDRFGIQPLFYYFGGSGGSDGFAFATEMAALRKLPLFQPDDIRLDAVLDFLAVQYIPGEKTLYNHFFKLLPGYALSYSLQDGKIQMESYNAWPQYGVNRHIPYADACTELRSLMENAIQSRIAGKADVKTFLSGGLDSAIVTGLAMKMTDISVISASISDEMCREYDEKDDALATFEHLCKRTGKMPVHQVISVGSGCLDGLCAYDEPYADASIFPFTALCHATKSGTVLTGEGGDELFFGYDRYRAMQLFRYVQFLPCGLLAKLCPSGGERSRFGRLKRFLKTASESSEKRYFGIVSHDAKAKIGDLAGEKLKEVRSSFFSVGGTDDSMSAAEAATRFDMQYYLPGDCFPKCRFGSLGTDCVFPMPFLDNAIADFAIALPLEYKLQGKRGKRILYDTFADILPADMPFRKKRGFGVPIGKWLCCDRKPLLHDAIVKNPPACFDKWFDRNRISAMIDEHASGIADHSYLLYSLFSLSLYLKKHSTP